MRISRVVNGSESVIAQVTQDNPAVSTFFHIKGSVTGSTLSLELDGVTVLTAADATFSRGSVGIDLGSRSTLSYRADNFTAMVAH